MRERWRPFFCFVLMLLGVTANMAGSTAGMAGDPMMQCKSRRKEGLVRVRFAGTSALLPASEPEKEKEDVRPEGRGSQSIESMQHTASSI